MSTAKVSIPDLATTAATATVTTTTAAASVAAVAAAESPAAHGLSGVVPIAQGGVSRVPHHWSRGASSMSLVASLSHDPPALHTHSHSHPHSGTQSNSGTQSLSLSSSSSSSSSGSTTAPLLLHDHNGASQFEQAFATTHAPFCMNESADKSVFIIYTGGTIGMKKQTNGSLSVEPGYLTQQMNDLPDFRSSEMPKTTVVEWDPLLDSSDVNMADWERLARQIEAVYYDYDGFVVLHGTDTMAYTACALSFMLENLGKPVIITGSLIPFADVYNDARRNLIVSVLYAARFDIPEVCIFFNNQLLRGNRASKVDTFGLSAFASPNFPPLGTLGTDLSLRQDLLLSPPKRRFRVFTKFDENVAVLRLTPGFSDTVVRNLLQPPLRGIVLEMYGVGNAPARRQGLMDVLAEAVKRGVVIVVISQCSRGFVNLSTYANGLALRDHIGVVSGADMTPEAAATKLGYLLARGLANDEIRTLLHTNIRGELSPSQST